MLTSYHTPPWFVHKFVRQWVMGCWHSHAPVTLNEGTAIKLAPNCRVQWWLPYLDKRKLVHQHCILSQLFLKLNYQNETTSLDWKKNGYETHQTSTFSISNFVLIGWKLCEIMSTDIWPFTHERPWMMVNITQIGIKLYSSVAAITTSSWKSLGDTYWRVNKQ